MKRTAFVIGALILLLGAIGVVVPSVLVWITRLFEQSGAGGFLLVAAIRVGFGVVLVLAAPASRMPRSLRVLGYVIVVAGLAAAVAGVTAVSGAHALLDWWLEQGTGLIRLASIILVAIGGFVAYACAPGRRAD